MLLLIRTCKYVFETLLSLPLDIYAAVRLQNHVVILFLIFWGRLSFTVVVYFIILPIISKVSKFIHILVNICCFSFLTVAIQTECGAITLWFWLHFLDEAIMLGILSYSYWSFMYVKHRCVCVCVRVCTSAGMNPGLHIIGKCSHYSPNSKHHPLLYQLRDKKCSLNMSWMYARFQGVLQS